VNRKLIIGTRGSDLALWQANFVKDKLSDIGLDAELKIIKTQGDRTLDLRLDKLEGKGFFTKELEEKLIEEEIDIAVHSYKDLPTQITPGLIIAAISDREEPGELLLILKDCVEIHQKLSVKFGGMVGTSSNRRKAQLLAIRPDLEIETLRGNIITRIEKLRDENYDAIMVAKAGIKRLGIDTSEFYVEELQPIEFIPAPAQGVLAIQTRENDTELNKELQAIHNSAVAEMLAVEREVLKIFEGGCHLPLGCYCRKDAGKFQTWTSKADDGESFPDRVFIESRTTKGLAEKIVAKFSPGRKLPSIVFITRDISENSYFRKAMDKHQIEIYAQSLIRIYPTIHKLDPFILKNADWIFFSSKNAIEYFFKLEPRLSKKTKFGVIGRGSEDMLRQLGKLPHFTGEDEGVDTEDIAEKFAAIANGKTIIFPGAKDSLRTIQKALSSRTKIIDLPVYETVVEDEVPKSFADVLIFTSPSNVEAYFADNLLEPGQRVICIGKSTGKKISELGVKYTLPYSPDEIGLAEAVFGLDYK
jgi:hydroxymethylbilane synthase